MTATERPSDLKPCPFCESQRVRVVNIRDGLRISCSDCLAEGPPVFYGPEGTEEARRSAIAVWNYPTTQAPAVGTTNPPEIGSKSVVEPTAEHWRRAIMEGLRLVRFAPSPEWFEQRARELAQEGE